MKVAICQTCDGEYSFINDHRRGSGGRCLACREAIRRTKYQDSAKRPRLRRNPVKATSPKRTSAIGAMSEHLAIARLIGSGHSVAIPVVDDEGVDFVVDYRLRVQVKSASYSSTGYNWSFNFTKARRVAGGLWRNGSSLTTEMAEVLICHAPAADAWWVIPREALLAVGAEGRLAIGLSLEPRTQSKYAGLSTAYRDAWHVFDDLAAAA